MDLNKIQIYVFNLVLGLTWILYFMITFNLSINAPQYLTDLQYYIKLYVSILLIWRFNPLRKIQFNELDKKIAFSAGIFLITTTAIGILIEKYLKNVMYKVKNLVNNIYY
jgi:hypothetical protein